MVKILAVALSAMGWIFTNHQGSQVQSRQKVETFPGINIFAHDIMGS